MKNVYFRLILTSLLCFLFLGNTKVLAYGKQLPIEDELLNPDLYTTVPFRLSVYKNKHENEPIKDELLEDSNFITKSKQTFLSDKIIPDEYFIEKSIDLSKVRKINPKNNYDFTKEQIPIQIKIAQHLKSTRQITEGSSIPFIAQHDFEINGKKFNQGTTILGRVETISNSDKMGTPETLVISNFYIPAEQDIELSGSISKNGANRSIWVYPLYQAGNITFYVAGFVFVPIHGGRAKLSTSETFTLFYENNN